MARKQALMMVVALSGLVMAGGCMSFDEAKFGNQVRKWVPVGTSEKEAERIMGKHGFECTLEPAGSPFNHANWDYLDCVRDYEYMHTWTARLQIKDDKVSGYDDMTVE